MKIAVNVTAIPSFVHEVVRTLSCMITTSILTDVRKIAVLRANALGDYLFAVPALTALRETYPDAEIVLLGLHWHGAFLAGCAGPVDRVEVVPPYNEVGYLGEPQPEAEAQFFDAMRAEHFDLALQIHGGGRNSNPFVQRLGARVTAGLCTPDAPRLDRWLPYVYYQSEIMRYLEVVRLVGATTSAIEPTLARRADDLAEARRVLSANRVVIVHPGATDPRRRWPVAQFAAVVDALAADGATIAVSGTASERPLVEAVIAAMHAPAIDLCDRLSIGGFAGALALADLLVSNDTGPFHLAAQLARLRSASSGWQMLSPPSSHSAQRAAWRSPGALPARFVARRCCTATMPMLPATIVRRSSPRCQWARCWATRANSWRSRSRARS